MNRAALPTAFALVLASTLAFAQQTQPQPSDAQAPASALARTPDPHRQTLRIAKQLNLTPDQTAKVEPILADRDQKLTALRANTTIDPKTAKKQMHAIQLNTQQQLSTILSADQLHQMQSLKHSHGAKSIFLQPTAPAA